MIIQSIKPLDEGKKYCEPKAPDNTADFLTSLMQSIKSKDPIVKEEKCKDETLEAVETIEDEDTELNSDILDTLAIFSNNLFIVNPNSDNIWTDLGQAIDNESKDIITDTLPQMTNEDNKLHIDLENEFQNIVLSPNHDKVDAEIHFTDIDYSLKDNGIDGAFKDSTIKESYSSYENTIPVIEDNPKEDLSVNYINDDKIGDETADKISGKIEKDDFSNDEIHKEGNKATLFNSYIHSKNIVESNYETEEIYTIQSKGNIQNINDAIINLVETAVDGETSMMKVQMFPKDLGTVNVIVKMENGKLNTKILVENDRIKQLFSNKVNELSLNLEKQKVNMETIHIEINDSFNFSSNNSFDSSEHFKKNNNEFSKGYKNYIFKKEESSKIDISDKIHNYNNVSILV